eukprot:GHVQ01036066.1.p1 GENE.GHVQ01036066.1~~GHVQ01036066.1.p1  ORF type:complete len:548 (+),score=63.90 GHVQ01036066.1:818-2461(+)
MMWKSTVIAAIESLKKSIAGINQNFEKLQKQMELQDRIANETQQDLRSKCTHGELEMVENRFHAYATKDAVDKVEKRLGDYSLQISTEALEVTLKQTVAQLNLHWRGPQIEANIQAVKDWVSAEFANFAKRDDTSHAIKHLEADIKEHDDKVSRALATTEDRYRTLSERVASIYVELNSEIDTMATKESLDDVSERLQEYAKLPELRSLREDTLPKLKFCVDSIDAFYERLNTQDAGIQRIDELLLDKASKYDIVVVNSRIELCQSKDKAASEQHKLIERMEWIQRRLEHYVETESARLSQFRPPDYTEVFHGINNSLTMKADQVDFEEIRGKMADREKTENLGVLQERLQKQLEYLAVTALGMAKLSLSDPKPGESRTLKAQQKSQILVQAEHLWQWIITNEMPPAISPPEGTELSASCQSGSLLPIIYPTSPTKTNLRHPPAVPPFMASTRFSQSQHSGSCSAAMGIPRPSRNQMNVTGNPSTKSSTQEGDELSLVSVRNGWSPSASPPVSRQSLTRKSMLHTTAMKGFAAGPNSTELPPDNSQQ